MSDDEKRRPIKFTGEISPEGFQFGEMVENMPPEKSVGGLPKRINPIAEKLLKSAEDLNEELNKLINEIKK